MCPKKNQDNESLFRLAFDYKHGQNVGKDPKEAARLYRLAAEQGHSPSAYNLALMYEEGEGIEKNEQEALHFFKLSAENGLTLAQFRLGYLYENGFMVAKNHRVAISWYQRAAKQKNNESMYRLSELYRKEQKEPEARKWLQSAAQQGHRTAQYELALRYSQEEKEVEALKWLKLAAKQGHIQAQYNLGIKYQKGQGVEKSLQKAKKWYRLAGEKNKDALYAYALLCEADGEYKNATKAYRLLDDDYPHASNWCGEAIFTRTSAYYHNPRFRSYKLKLFLLKDAEDYFKKAAEAGHPAACYNLGVLYEHFYDKLNKKYDKHYQRIYQNNAAHAFEYYQSAASKGHAAATYQLGRLYYYGLGVEKDKEKALNLYKKAAVDYQFPEAQFRLACHYYKKDEQKDEREQETIKWLKLAVSKGHEEARRVLCTVYPAATELKDIVGELNERLNAKNRHLFRHKLSKDEFRTIAKKKLLAGNLDFFFTLPSIYPETKELKLSVNKNSLTRKKIELANALDGLLQKYEFTSVEENKIIDLCHAIYGIRRHSLNFFKTDSTDDFQKWLKAKNLKINPKLPITKQKLYSLLEGDPEKNLLDFIKESKNTKTLVSSSLKR